MVISGSELWISNFHIQKCVLYIVLMIEIHNSFMFAYGSWHLESYLCCSGKLLDGEIRKWHISSEFVYLKLCNLTYVYKYSKGKFFKSLWTKQTFHVWMPSELIWCRKNRLTYIRTKVPYVNSWTLVSFSFFFL